MNMNPLKLSLLLGCARMNDLKFDLEDVMTRIQPTGNVACVASTAGTVKNPEYKKNLYVPVKIFKHQITFYIQHLNRIYKAKVFATGSISVAGGICEDLSDIMYCIHEIMRTFKELGFDPKINNVYRVSSKYKTTLIDKNLKINLNKLSTEYKEKIEYNAERFSGLIIRYDYASIYVFTSGKINIASKNYEDVMKAFNEFNNIVSQFTYEKKIIIPAGLEPPELKRQDNVELAAPPTSPAVAPTPMPTIDVEVQCLPTL